MTETRDEKGRDCMEWVEAVKAAGILHEKNRPCKAKASFRFGRGINKSWRCDAILGVLRA